MSINKIIVDGASALEATTSAGAAELVLHSTARKFLNAMEAAQGPSPLHALGPEVGRAILDKLRVGAVADDRKVSLPVGPTGHTDAHIVRPRESRKRLPVVWCLHGGGQTFGDFDACEGLARWITYDAKGAVALVDYTLSPAANSPATIEQNYAATHMIAEHGLRFDLDTERLAIASDSVVGKTTVVIALLAEDHDGVKTRALCPLYPEPGANLNDSPYATCADCTGLAKVAMKGFWNVCQPNAVARKDIHESSLLATIDEPKSPPLITDQGDVLRHKKTNLRSRVYQGGRPDDIDSPQRHNARPSRVNPVGRPARRQSRSRTSDRRLTKWARPGRRTTKR